MHFSDKATRISASAHLSITNHIGQKGPISHPTHNASGEIAAYDDAVFQNKVVDFSFIKTDTIMFVPVLSFRIAKQSVIGLVAAVHIDIADLVSVTIEGGPERMSSIAYRNPIVCAEVEVGGQVDDTILVETLFAAVEQVGQAGQFRLVLDGDGVALVATERLGIVARISPAVIWGHILSSKSDIE